MMKILLAALLALSLGNAAAQETTGLESRGAYAGIDVRKTLDLIAGLRSQEAGTRDAALETALRAPNDFAPPVHYLAVAMLVEKGRPEEGVFWFYVAHMRAVNDATILTDRSASAGVDSLLAQAAPVLEYAHANPDVWWRKANEALEWERSHPPAYDRRWLALHGMNAIRSSLTDGGSSGSEEPITVPRDTWDDIAKRNRSRMLEIVKSSVEAAKASGVPAGNAG